MAEFTCWRQAEVGPPRLHSAGPDAEELRVELVEWCEQRRFDGLVCLTTRRRPRDDEWHVALAGRVYGLTVPKADRRTVEERRQAVLDLLAERPGLSVNAVAEAVGVCRHLVLRVRARLATEG
jgi:hypothetical protein